jgi:hypothetical protein
LEGSSLAGASHAFLADMISAQTYAKSGRLSRWSKGLILAGVARAGQVVKGSVHGRWLAGNTSRLLLPCTLSLVALELPYAPQCPYALNESPPMRAPVWPVGPCSSEIFSLHKKEIVVRQFPDFSRFDLLTTHGLGRQ